MALYERDYLERTIATVRNHRGADNCWPEWANMLADEIEALWAELDKCVGWERKASLSAELAETQARDLAARVGSAEEALREAFSWIACLPDGRPNNQATCAFVPRDVFDRLAAAAEREGGRA